MNKQLMQQAQMMQKKLAKMQEELETAAVEGSAGGGAVKVTVTGKFVAKKVEIQPEAAQDIDLLQDLVLTAYNDAVTKAQDLAQKKLQAIGMGGMPGLGF